MKSILVIAPHPDDEILGCGGTLLKHTANSDTVCCVIVTKAYTPDWSEKFLHTREQEIKKAHAIMKIEKCYFLDLPTVKVDTIPQKQLNDALARIISEVKPEIVYTPSGVDLNKDHRLVHEAVLVATRPTHAPFVKRVLAYETVSETEWGIAPFVPQVYVDISDVLTKKLGAMKAYASELRQYPHPRSLEGIEILAKKRGIEAGARACEAFSLIREIIQ